MRLALSQQPHFGAPNKRITKSAVRALLPPGACKKCVLLTRLPLSFGLSEGTCSRCGVSRATRYAVNEWLHGKRVESRLMSGANVLHNRAFCCSAARNVCLLCKVCGTKTEFWQGEREDDRKSVVVCTVCNTVFSFGSPTVVTGWKKFLPFLHPEKLKGVELLIPYTPSAFGVKVLILRMRLMGWFLGYRVRRTRRTSLQNTFNSIRAGSRLYFEFDHRTKTAVVKVL